MLERIGKQLAKAESTVQRPATGMVLILVFAWAFSGWMVTQSVTDQLYAADELRLAAKDSNVIVYVYGRTNTR